MNLAVLFEVHVEQGEKKVFNIARAIRAEIRGRW